MLVAELVAITTPLTEERSSNVSLPLEPALSKGVVPARVEPPAYRQRAENPRVAGFLAMVRRVAGASVAAFLR